MFATEAHHGIERLSAIAVNWRLGGNQRRPPSCGSPVCKLKTFKVKHMSLLSHHICLPLSAPETSIMQVLQPPRRYTNKAGAEHEYEEDRSTRTCLNERGDVEGKSGSEDRSSRLNAAGNKSPFRCGPILANIHRETNQSPRKKRKSRYAATRIEVALSCASSRMKQT
jgi:hypothetical protein